MKKLLNIIFSIGIISLILFSMVKIILAQSSTCGTICSQSGCYGTCNRIGQYCLQPPASCPGAGGDVVEQVFQCLGTPPSWVSQGTQIATSSCCGSCSLPTPTPMNGNVCSTGAVQVLFVADTLPNPSETVTCDVVQNDMRCAPCQGLLKSDSCSIDSSSTNQQCSIATIDAACRDFVYKCRLNGIEFATGVVPNPVNNSTSYISLTLPTRNNPPTSCSCNPPADSHGWRDNFCFHTPETTGCDMTFAGGYCDPNGDKDYTDADWVRGYYDYQAVCGSAGPTRPAPTATPSSQNCYNSCIASGKPADVCSALCRPTNTPTPSFTPTPTKFQRQVLITVAPTFSPIGNDQNPPSNMDAQRWACVNSSPCSEILSLCQGTSGDDTKRAKLNGVNLLPSSDTYILECLINTDDSNGLPKVGPQCTTGNETVDKQLLGTSLLNDLRSKYNYTLIGIFDTTNGTSTPIPAGQPVRSDNQGRIGPIEWESTTHGFQVGRMFVAMNSVDPKGIQGNAPAQKQGLFDLTDLPTTSCLMLTWDPEGQIIDKKTKKPIKGAKITILKKNEKGDFNIVSADEVLGGIVNPYTTGNDGKYMFRVPSGVYKLKVDAVGFNTYTSDEFIEKNKPTHIDIALESK